jgi:hypothetical protein
VVAEEEEAAVFPQHLMEAVVAEAAAFPQALMAAVVVVVEAAAFPQPPVAVVVGFLHRPVCPRRRFQRPVSQRRARLVRALRLLA